MTQQCNPVPMEIAATWRFPTTVAAKLFEKGIEDIFPEWNTGGPEWYQVSAKDIHTNEAFRKLLDRRGGIFHSPVPFVGRFRETLSPGVCGTAYKPHLYLISEEPSTGACKLVLSAYNWPTAVSHYMTYNPRTLNIAGRWSFRCGTDGKAFFEKLKRHLMPHCVNPRGWFRMNPDETITIISEAGATPYPRTSPIDDKVCYNGCRVPSGR